MASHLPKNIFFRLLALEAETFTFLDVLPSSEMKSVLEAAMSSGKVYPCPDRCTDVHCKNKNPSYPTAVSHFKPSDSHFRKEDKKKWFIDAIATTWTEYDPNIKYDPGDIAKMVWYKYREARRYVLDEDVRLRTARNAARVKARNDAQRIADRKKDEKERQQYLDLAAKYPESYKGCSRRSVESDMDWGMRCFTLRMKADQAKKNTRQREHTEAALKRYAKWVTDHPNYDSYGNDKAEDHIQFSHLNPFSTSTTSVRNSKRYRVPHRYMKQCLQLLSEHSFSTFTDSRDAYLDLSVTVTVDWPRRDNNGFPNYAEIGFTTSTLEWSKLQGNERTSLPLVRHIRGLYTGKNGRPVLVLNRRQAVCKMYPKEYSEFEYLNKSKTYTLRTCMSLPEEYTIMNIKVAVINKKDFPFIEIRGTTMSKDAIRGWKDKVGYDTKDNWSRYYYDMSDPKQTKIHDMLKEVQAKKKARAVAARKAGLQTRDKMRSQVLLMQNMFKFFQQANTP